MIEWYKMELIELSLDRIKSAVWLPFIVRINISVYHEIIVLHAEKEFYCLHLKMKYSRYCSAKPCLFFIPKFNMESICNS